VCHLFPAPCEGKYEKCIATLALSGSQLLICSIASGQVLLAV